MKVACTIATLLLVTTGLVSAQTVSVTLDSSQAGQTVSPGATIDWTISFTVSTGDNAGLAMMVCDLVQDGANPEFFDIPPASGVPVPMVNFSRPAGITNPGEGDPTTGYPGVQRGSAGAMNVVQIGGGQNNFGEAMPPGTGVAENANMVGGVGQSGSVFLAQGTFAAPSTEGDYTFSLANAVANVITQLNTPPNFSPVASATVSIAGASFTFTVGGGIPGDVDGDGDVDLSDLAALLAAYDTCTGEPGYNPAADFDSSGCVDLSDLATLLANYN